MNITQNKKFDCKENIINKYVRNKFKNLKYQILSSSLFAISLI